ncbi:MAG: hypothetical protein GY939_27235 [Actinomycetia bacterium]|nr:hypothetical protein [Actinomycetes bacterium]
MARRIGLRGAGHADDLDPGRELAALWMRVGGGRLLPGSLFRPVDRRIASLECQATTGGDDSVDLSQGVQPVFLVNEVLGDVSHHHHEICGLGRYVVSIGDA